MTKSPTQKPSDIEPVLEHLRAQREYASVPDALLVELARAYADLTRYGDAIAADGGEVVTNPKTGVRTRHPLAVSRDAAQRTVNHLRREARLARERATKEAKKEKSAPGGLTLAQRLAAWLRPGDDERQVLELAKRTGQSVDKLIADAAHVRRQASRGYSDRLRAHARANPMLANADAWERFSESETAIAARTDHAVRAMLGLNGTATVEEVLK